MKTCKFMNGWLVKIKDIDKIKKSIRVSRKEALEDLYVYGWAIRTEIDTALNYKEAIITVFYLFEDVLIERVNDFAIMKAGTKYLVLDITALCESCKGSFGSDNLYSLYDLLEGKF